MADKIPHQDVRTDRFKIEPAELAEVVDEFSTLLEKIELYNPHVDKELIKRALRFAAVAHAGQRRKSGMPFIYHGIQTAIILADLHLDSVMIACGILHDVVEDTAITIEDVKREFGDEIGTIIAGLTKIHGLKLLSWEEQQAENFRRMILHTAKDPRTIIVKFADRLHNMRTLEFLAPEKRLRIAHETLEVFAPLAHRFGIYTIKTELEDLAFFWLYPEEYRALKEQLDASHNERDDFLLEFLDPIKRRLTEENIDHTVQWRLKHLYSIYRKMIKENKEIDEIYDLFAVRIIVPSIAECYHALGVIHALYTPIVARIKDFIATPKFNMYQSLHTTVASEKKGRMVEVQIRTWDMHQTAESGIAAHWRYKEGRTKLDDIDTYTAWLRKVVDWEKGTPEADEFMRELKMDLFQDEIFVFTPKGDLIQLPSGSTPIDFAFALHTELGLHCKAARVNGRLVPLDTRLSNGQWVDIATSAKKNPNPEWLNTVKTAKARSLIRRWIKRQFQEESQKLGQEMVIKLEKLRGSRIMDDERDKLQSRYHQKTWDGFLAALGIGDISFHSVQNVLGIIPQVKKEKSGTAKGKIGVCLQGMDNLLVSYASCCKPLPGDDIVGYVSRGRGLVIHRSDCENIANLPADDQRTIQVSWEPSEDEFFVASIRVEGGDRKGFLSDVSAAIAKYNCDIRSATVTTRDGIAFEDFDVDVKNLTDLHRLMNEIRKVKGVTRVERRDVRGLDATDRKK